MNKVILIGRLTRDPEIRYTNEGLSIARFSVAVDRISGKKDGNEQTADFPSVICFGKTAEFIEKYFHKGMRIGLEGRIQTGNYTNKEGQKVYTTDVVAERVEFVESRGSSGGGFGQSVQDIGDGFMSIPDGVEDAGLPFN
ncbi:MAG: single-stranded DNA-binding protein [Oribacterium sp.]